MRRREEGPREEEEGGGIPLAENSPCWAVKAGALSLQDLLCIVFLTESGYQLIGVWSRVMLNFKKNNRFPGFRPPRSAESHYCLTRNLIPRGRRQLSFATPAAQS